MSGTDFFDTNVLVYSVSADADKAGRAEKLIVSGGVISVQVLNEFVSVTTRKLGKSLSLARVVLTRFRAICSVVPIDIETHDDGLDLAERYKLPVYDGMIVAAALRAGCRTLYSEDFADGQVIEGLAVRNPFATRP